MSMTTRYGEQGVDEENGTLAVSTMASVRYIDRPTRPAEACLDRCEQMRAREASGGAGGQWPPATSRPGDI